mgnify:FL=1
MAAREKLMAEFQKSLNLGEETKLVEKLQRDIVIQCELSRCPPRG